MPHPDYHFFSDSLYVSSGCLPIPDTALSRSLFNSLSSSSERSIHPFISFGTSSACSFMASPFSVNEINRILQVFPYFKLISFQVKTGISSAFFIIYQSRDHPSSLLQPVRKNQLYRPVSFETLEIQDPLPLRMAAHTVSHGIMLDKLVSTDNNSEIIFRPLKEAPKRLYF